MRYCVVLCGLLFAVFVWCGCECLKCVCAVLRVLDQMCLCGLCVVHCVAMCVLACLFVCLLCLRAGVCELCCFVCVFCV